MTAASGLLWCVPLPSPAMAGTRAVSRKLLSFRFLISSASDRDHGGFWWEKIGLFGETCFPR